jgi:hypothetical protein
MLCCRHNDEWCTAFPHFPLLFYFSSSLWVVRDTKPAWSVASPVDSLPTWIQSCNSWGFSPVELQATAILTSAEVFHLMSEKLEDMSHCFIGCNSLLIWLWVWWFLQISIPRKYKISQLFNLYCQSPKWLLPCGSSDCICTCCCNMALALPLTASQGLVQDSEITWGRGWGRGVLSEHFEKENRGNEEFPSLFCNKAERFASNCICVNWSHCVS